MLFAPVSWEFIASVSPLSEPSRITRVFSYDYYKLKKKQRYSGSHFRTEIAV